MVFNATFINISAMYIYINCEGIGKGGNWLFYNACLTSIGELCTCFILSLFKRWSRIVQKKRKIGWTWVWKTEKFCSNLFDEYVTCSSLMMYDSIWRFHEKYNFWLVNNQLPPLPIPSQFIYMYIAEILMKVAKFSYQHTS
jgi:hypothetical protein